MLFVKGLYDNLFTVCLTKAFNFVTKKKYSLNSYSIMIRVPWLTTCLQFQPKLLQLLIFTSSVMDTKSYK